MTNKFITPVQVADAALESLDAQTVLLQHTDRSYESEFKGKIGDTLTVKRPIKYVANDGPELKVQSVEQGSTKIKVTQHKQVAFQLTAAQLTLDVKKLQEEVIDPVMVPIAHAIENDLANLYSLAHLYRGTPGTTPGTFADVSLIAQAMDEMSVPGKKMGYMNPAAAYKIADNLKGAYVERLAGTAYEQAVVARYAGLDIMKSVTNPIHTVGNYGGTPLVKGAGQGVTYASVKDSDATVMVLNQTLLTDGWTADRTGVLKKGDVITIDGVRSVNPLTYKSTGALQTFTVVEDANSDGSGNATLKISPPIITSGPYQTVTAAPADDAQITVKTGNANTSHVQNLVMPDKTLALATVPLELPQEGAGVKAVRRTYKGVSMQMTYFYDGSILKNVYRMDIMYGVGIHYAENFGRLTG